MSTPFHQDAYKNFVKSVKPQKWDFHLVLKSSETGKVVHSGNSKLSEELVNQKHAKAERDSREWIPTKPISKMPTKMSETLSSTESVRKYSSLLLSELLAPKQRQGHGDFVLWDIEIETSKMIHNQKTLKYA